MSHHVWLRVSLVFGALVATFALSGLLVTTNIGSPLGVGIEQALALFNYQSAPAKNCEQSQSSSYSPFSITKKKEPTPGSGNQGSSNGQPSNNSSSGSSQSGITIDEATGELLSWLAILVVAVIVIGLIYFLFKNLLGRPIYRDRPGGINSSENSTGFDRNISASDAFSEADALAARGDYRGALRLLY